MSRFFSDTVARDLPSDTGHIPILKMDTRHGHPSNQGLSSSQFTAYVKRKKCPSCQSDSAILGSSGLNLRNFEKCINDSWECSQFHSKMTPDYTSYHLQFQFFCGGISLNPPSSSIRSDFASVGHVYLLKYEYKLTQSAYATEFRKPNCSWLYDYPLANHIASYE